MQIPKWLQSILKTDREPESVPNDEEEYPIPDIQFVQGNLSVELACRRRAEILREKYGLIKPTEDELL